MKFLIYLSPFIFLLLLAVTVIEFNNKFLCFFTLIISTWARAGLTTYAIYGKR